MDAFFLDLSRLRISIIGKPEISNLYEHRLRICFSRVLRLQIKTSRQENTREFIARNERVFRLAFKKEDQDRNIDLLKKTIWRGLKSTELHDYLTEKHFELVLQTGGTLQELKEVISKWEDKQRAIKQAMEPTYAKDRHGRRIDVQQIKNVKKRSKYQSSDDSSDSSSDTDSEPERQSKRNSKSSSKPKRRSSKNKPNKENEKLVEKLLYKRIKNSNYMNGRIIVKEKRIPDSVKSSKYWFGLKHYVPDQKQFTAYLKEARREAADTLMEKCIDEERRKHKQYANTIE